MRYYYRAFGLVMVSELELPELPRFEGGAPPDVEILRGIVPDALEEPLKAGVRYQIKPGHLLLRMDGVARFYVSRGSRVVVEQAPGAKDEDVKVFLLGSVLGALVHQRKLLPLHASGIRVDDGCVIFCGASGSGKSTAANAFVRRGYPLHTDDICVVAPGQNGRPIAYPGYPVFKLWEDSLLESGDNPASYERLRESLNKYSVPAPGPFNGEALPVRKMYVLSPYNKDEISISELSGIDKFNALRGQTYKFKFVKFMGAAEAYFRTVGLVGNRVPIAIVNRPIRTFLSDRLADALEEDFKG
jgi:hypothetical protein